MMQLEKDEATDLEELIGWASCIISCGALAVSIVIGAIGTSFWAFGGY
jgi:hypothetical protein